MCPHISHFLAQEKLHILYIGLTYSYNFFLLEKLPYRIQFLEIFRSRPQSCDAWSISVWFDSWIFFNNLMFCYVNTGWEQAVKHKLSVWTAWPQTQCTAIAKPLHENNKMTLAGESNLYQIKVFTVTAELRKGKIQPKRTSTRKRNSRLQCVYFNVALIDFLCFI